MLVFLMLGEVEALDLLRTCKGHSHLAILFVLVSILLFHLPNLGMLASLDFALIHELIVVFLLSSCLLVFTTLFATFVILLLVVLLLVISLSTTFTSLFATASRIIAIILIASVFSRFIVLSGFFSDLNNCDFAIVVKVNRSLNR
jgi:ABC-type multidrug transport system permease subunit